MCILINQFFAILFCFLMRLLTSIKIFLGLELWRLLWQFVRKVLTTFWMQIHGRKQMLYNALTSYLGNDTWHLIKVKHCLFGRRKGYFKTTWGPMVILVLCIKNQVSFSYLTQFYIKEWLLFASRPYSFLWI